ncbi:MAG: MGMT family protein [Candidatus Aminicenantes bacterium]|nr:MGMT family protein [Candidatus Aminicenantes bacterium]
MNKLAISTPFGSVFILWTLKRNHPKIKRILLPKPGMPLEEQVARFYPNVQTSSCREIDETAKRIKKFLEGEQIEFSLDSIELSLCSEFQQRVLRAEHQIPRGRVSTYGLIAGYLGKSGGARSVGNALAANPFPIIIPCHRAIRSDRHLGGFQGGTAMKRALLENEGIVFDDMGRIVNSNFYYKR